MKNKIFRHHFSKAFRFSVLLIAMLAVLCTGNVSSVRAESIRLQARQIVLVPGTVKVGTGLQAAVVSALQATPDIPSEAIYFAITDVRLDGNWSFVSVLGLAQVHDKQTWTLEGDGVWTGLVLLKRRPDGTWVGGTQGTSSFNSLMEATPGSFLNAKAKGDLARGLQSSTQSLQATAAYSFPWQPGTAMFYGNFGVHDNGFASLVSGWKAVDMMSDADTSAGHAPNRLLAAAAGTISYKCKDANNIAIHLGNFFYTHLGLANDAALAVGTSFAQGAYLGPLKVGTFSGPCGWASQPAGWFHVHWGFPNADLQVEDWTLSMSTQNWTNGATTITAGNGWITAKGMTSACAAPILSAPADGAVSASQAIAFKWLALNGCAFSGYLFRIKTVPTMDTDGFTVVDTFTSQLSSTQTISSDWNKQDLYWGVKAANAPYGAEWSVGRFQIDPGNGVPTDYGLCSNDGQRCAFSGLALVYYGASEHFVGPLAFSDGVDCNSSVFGDPLPGVAKQCFIRGGRPAGSFWCMNQGGTCSVGAGNLATVYYGINGRYRVKTKVLDSIACTNTAFGGDPFPTLMKACYYIVTGQAIRGTKAIPSNAFQDGWVLESGATSNVGGSMNSTAPTLRVGDDELNRQYRAILGFGTGQLPDHAVLTSVTLNIRMAASTDSNPFDSMGNLQGDIRKGPFGANTALQLLDWKAAATQYQALTILNTPVDSWYSTTLSPSTFSAINLTGPTQFRLGFVTPDNGNFTADYMEFYSGNYSITLSDRPTLTISYYYVP
jgi:hypothetical protein